MIFQERRVASERHRTDQPDRDPHERDDPDRFEATVSDALEDDL